jgi:hypothetical protein
MEKRGLVSVLQVTADGQATPQAGDLHTWQVDLLLDVHGGGITFQARGGSHDPLCDPTFPTCALEIT